MCSFIKEQCCLLVVVLPFIFLGSVGDMVVPYFVGKVVDAMRERNDSEVNRLILLWIYFLVGGSVCSFCNKFFFGWMSERIGLSVRSRLFKANINKDVTFFDTRSKGDLISRISSDTNII